MGERLKGKVAIVTGGGRGIGRGHCLAFAAEGAMVVVNDPGVARDGTGFDNGPANQVVDEIRRAGGKAVANYESVADYAGAERIIKSAIDNFGKLDILVNNAGMLREHMIWNMTEEEWRAVVDVHLTGHFNCTKFACVYFRNRWKEQKVGGRIINTSSDAGLGATGQCNYAAVKEGIVGFTRAVAREMGRFGVTCNAIRPGGATRMTLTPEVIANMERMRAMGGAIPSELANIEAMKPEDCAPLVVWLASDESANVNGEVFSSVTGQIGLYRPPGLWRSCHKVGGFTVDEVWQLAPIITAGLVNPAPPRE